ncbi:MAG: hypothetical protein C0623_13130 [Desulfuromonas sp.]|nr:MAG: hypothetical protein C0623_13130 [Desulfuromonas sp.]
MGSIETILFAGWFFFLKEGIKVENFYRVGFIFTRCFIQKTLQVSEKVSVIPLASTGAKGEIHNAKELLKQSGFSFSNKNVETAKENFKKVGQSILVSYEDIEANSVAEAININKQSAENIAKALSVVSANPVNLLCSFASRPGDSGVDFAFPNDRIIRHSTNVPGFLEIFPYFEKAAQSSAKISTLLSLYRASVRESDIDNRILFQLILLEEASDTYQGTLAERIRQLYDEYKLHGIYNQLLTSLAIELPEDKDVVDVLVKLRNAVAHDGIINRETINADWMEPIIDDKDKIPKLVGEAIRFMLCYLCGYNVDEHAIKLEGGKHGVTFEVKFD